MADRRFGRVYKYDARDQRYAMRHAIRAAGAVPMVWQIGPILDQGATPQCVAYACADFLSCTPIRTIVSTPDYEDALYHRAQLLDEIPGENYEGTTVRGGFMALQEQGHLGSYVWAQSEQEIFDFVSSMGPVVMGTDWYTGMDTPDSQGFIRPTGTYRGGHAWLVYGVYPDYYLMQNSWGDWGDGGTAKISRRDLASLLAAQGEAGAGVEQVITPEPPGPPDPPPPSPGPSRSWFWVVVGTLVAAVGALIAKLVGWF